MTRGAIIVDIDDTVSLWKRAGISGEDAWQALTGGYRQDVTWAHVKDFMLGWQLTYRRMTEAKRAA